MTASNHQLKQALSVLNEKVVNGLDADSVCESLIADGILTVSDRSTLADMAPGTSRTRWLLGLLHASRHTSAFVGLRRALTTDPVYDGLVEELDRVCAERAGSIRTVSEPGKGTSADETRPTNASSTRLNSDGVSSNLRQSRILSQGTDATVFLCHDLSNGRDYAVKQIKANSTQVDHAVDELQSRLQQLQTIHHTNIIRHYGCQRKQSSLNIFMECMPGGSIRDYIASCGPLPETIIQRYVRQILPALVYLHGRNITHSNIAADVLLRDHDGNVKLGGFGKSTLLKSTLLKSNLLGSNENEHEDEATPSQNESDADEHGIRVRKRDIWSLGCVVIEMLTGSTPTVENTSSALMQKNYQLPVGASPSAADFVTKCLEPNLDVRPTASELLNCKFCETPKSSRYC